MEKKIEKEFTETEIIDMAKGNHIWLNAIAWLKPTDEMLMDLGRDVLQMLRESEMVDDLSKTMPVVYIRLNMS